MIRNVLWYVWKRFVDGMETGRVCATLLKVNFYNFLKFCAIIYHI